MGYGRAPSEGRACGWELGGRCLARVGNIVFYCFALRRRLLLPTKNNNMLPSKARAAPPSSDEEDAWQGTGQDRRWLGRAHCQVEAQRRDALRNGKRKASAMFEESDVASYLDPDAIRTREAQNDGGAPEVVPYPTRLVSESYEASSSSFVSSGQAMKRMALADRDAAEAAGGSSSLSSSSAVTSSTCITQALCADSFANVLSFLSPTDVFRRSRSPPPLL